MSDTRPDPAELLARIRREEMRTTGADGSGGEAAGRGKLKIFFGMAPGVGKTFAMLAAAQRLAAQGVDVVCGVVETHGRAETERMLLGLDILPRRQIVYSGATLSEFDAEAAILRRPDILLVDELAHTNAPGSARQKRWQDVEECLKSGVNVYTTLNVQHLESINDVVAQITGVPVRETVPDMVFDQADEVELVDLPVDALHERLRAGKVYLGDNAARAVDPQDGFFRRGNLTALRELALRRTAAWVDSELRRYRQDRGIRALWPAGERIVVAVSPSPSSGRLIRAAKRMAAGLHADLLAVHVETPRTAHLSSADRDRLTQHMRLAESLGATATALAGDDAARELIAFARSRNVSKIVVGKTERSPWREAIFGSFISDLIRGSGDIDIHVVRGDDADAAGSATDDSLIGKHPVDHRRASRGSPTSAAAKLALTVAVVCAASAIALIFYRPPDLSEEAIVLLGGVVICSLWCGRGAAVLASVLSVVAFNFFFTEPRFSLSVNEPGHFLTFAVMLAVGLVVGTLAARTREQAGAARDRERRTAALYTFSRELASARDARDVAAVATRHARDTLHVDVIIAIPVQARSVSQLDVLAFAGEPDWFDDRERAVAQWAMDHVRPAGLGTNKLPASAGRYIPLVGTSGKLGLLGLRPPADGSAGFDAPSSLLIDAMVSQIASALERVLLSESRHAARLEAERERLRSALLSSVSHDLRTPLASITGAASTLEQSVGAAESGEPSVERLDPRTRASLLRTIVDESTRLNDIIANLVFATRLEAGASGAIVLNREWTTLEEVIGVGLSRHRADLAARPFRVSLPADLPMIRVDNAMLPQVVNNLIENALRYTPPGTPISISAWTADAQVIVKVADEGPGLADDEAAKVFQRFYRGRASRPAVAAGSPSSAGMGLGLTICEGVIRLHGGRIWAEHNLSRPPHGVAFMFSLPVEQPQPPMPNERPHDPNAVSETPRGLS